MTHALPPYPDYKDSGVAWLGQIPSHWEVRRLWSVTEIRVSNVDKHSKEGELPVRLCNYVDVYKNSKIYSDMKFMDATASPEEMERYRLKKNDVVITKDSEVWNDIGVPALVVSEAPDLICGYHLALLRPKQMLEGAFLLRSLQAPLIACHFHTEAKGVTRYGLTHNAIKSVPIPLPPLDEQAAIVRVLDFVDGRMRRYARAQQQTIRLLTEYKQALIHHAVTGKVNVCTGAPYTTYHDTGIEWLGQVPTHWELKPLKHWVRINARTLPETTSPDYEFRYIDIGTVGTGLLLKEPQPLRFGDAPSRARRVVQAGDTIISTVRTYLKAVYHVQEDEGDLVCSTGFAVLTPGAGAHPKYVSYLVQSDAFASCVSAESVGTAYPAITEGRLGRFYVPVPPLAEQGAIVEYLDAQTARIDAAIAAIRRTVALLGEYRERLVADVVTGKVDVRAAAAGLPEADDAADADAVDALLTPFAPDDAPTLEEALQDATDGHE